MAVITDPEVIGFCNAKLRPLLNQLGSALRGVAEFNAEYAAQGIGALVAGSVPLQQSYIADGSTNPDGTKGDGRTPILGYDVDAANGQMAALLAWVNGQSGMLAILTKPTTNTQPIL